MEEQTLLVHALQNSATQEAGFKTLIKEYQQPLYWHIRKIVFDHEDADDVLQNTYIKVFKNIHKFKFEGPLGAWIRRTVVFTAINAYHKKQRENKLVVAMANTGYLDYSVNDIAGHLEAAEIVKLVNQLPKKAQQILKLYSIEGYKHQEIANMLDISVGTSKSQLNRAKKLLQISINSLHEK